MPQHLLNAHLLALNHKTCHNSVLTANVCSLCVSFSSAFFFKYASIIGDVKCIWYAKRLTSALFWTSNLSVHMCSCASEMYYIIYVCPTTDFISQTPSKPFVLYAIKWFSRFIDRWIQSVLKFHNFNIFKAHRIALMPIFFLVHIKFTQKVVFLCIENGNWKMTGACVLCTTVYFRLVSAQYNVYSVHTSLLHEE